MRKDLYDQILKLKEKVQQEVNKLPSHPMGHAYLWGTVSVKLKNGKTKKYRSILGGICVNDLSKAVEIANSIEGVENVYYNLD